MKQFLDSKHKKTNKRFYQGRSRLSILIPTARSMAAAAASLLAPGRPRVWLIRGQLGAGKTTLVRAALRHLGVTGRILSPTYTIVKRYPLRQQRWLTAVHIDAYRLLRPSEVAALELHEQLADPQTIVFIEWPDRIPQKNWGGVWDIAIRPQGQGRRITARMRPPATPKVAAQPTRSAASAPHRRQSSPRR